MFTIRRPTVETEAVQTVVRTSVEVDGQSRELWFRCPVRYAQYLTVDRCDAFVAMLLYYAMMDGHDIGSELPISAQLKYQLDNVFFPALHEYDPRLHMPRLDCPVETEPYPPGTAVGTGFSCGVDSLTALCTNRDRHAGFDVDQPCHFSVGQFHSDDGKTYYADRHDQTRANALAAAAFLGLELLYVDTNLAEQFPVKFARVNTYANVGVALMFQRLLRRYLVPSSYKVSDFSFHKFSDPSYFETFVLSCLSTENLLFLPANSEMDRLQKMAVLKDEQIAHRHLSPCGAVSSGKKLNCGKCQKCLRTLGCLDALESLDKFGEVFDVDAYRKNRVKNIAFLISVSGENTNSGIVPALRQGSGIPFKSWLLSIPYLMARPFVRFFESHLSYKSKQRIRHIMGKANIHTPY